MVFIKMPIVECVEKAGAILICKAILIICVSNVRNRRDMRGEENKLLLQL